MINGWLYVQKLFRDQCLIRRLLENNHLHIPVHKIILHFIGEYVKLLLDFCSMCLLKIVILYLKPPFQIKAVIDVKTNSTLSDKTDLKSRTDLIDTTGQIDMVDSMTDLTSKHKGRSKLQTCQIVCLKYCSALWATWN